MAWTILLVAILASSMPACAPTGRGESETPPPSVLAVFPFANLTESGGAAGLIVPPLCARLAAQGFSCISDKDLRPLLRKRRIRSGGMPTGEDLALIGRQIDAQAILLGSIDFFREDGNPELGMSIRILDLSSLEVLFARSRAVTAADFSGLFGIGRRDSVQQLVAPLLDKLLGGLDPERLGRIPESEGRAEAPRMALLGFENRSEYPRAGDIFTRILFSGLFEAGCRMLDPTLINQVYLAERRAPKGKVDLRLAGRIGEDLGAEWIVTGGVSGFHPAAPDGLDAPGLEIYSRMLDARTGKIVFHYDDERRGTPPAQVFGFGERRSLGRLASEAAADVAGRLAHEIEEKHGAEN